MPTIARDYSAAVALIAANPNAHFSVDQDGHIQKTSRIKALFGQRDVVHQQTDHAVGAALLHLYDRALASGPAQAASLVNPRQLAVVARFIQAHDQAQAAGQAPSAGASNAAFNGRKPSAPGLAPTDAGTRQLREIQRTLAANGLVPSDMVSHVRRMQAAAADQSPDSLSAFNNFALGGGNITFSVLFHHPECTDPSVAPQVRHARYAACARPYVDAAKAKLQDGEAAFVAKKIADGLSPDDAQTFWDMNRLTTGQMMETNATLDHQLRSGKDCLLALGAYIAAAKAQGLDATQAMTPIRLWMGSGTEALASTWQSQAHKAPPLDELGLVARLIEEDIPLSDLQAQLAKQFFPPPSS